MTPTVITGPAREPVTKNEIKTQLHLTDPSDPQELFKVEAELDLYIGAARRYVEARTGRTIHEETLEIVLDAWPCGNAIVLPRATPLIAISSVIYKDSAGIAITWATSDYLADTDSLPGRLVLAYNASFPTFVPFPVSPIRIRYRAGIVAGASPQLEAPEDLKLAVLLLVGAMNENREAEVVTNQARIEAMAMHYGVEAFISRHIVSYAF